MKQILHNDNDIEETQEGLTSEDYGAMLRPTAIIKLLTETRRALSLSKISRMLNTHKSTVLRTVDRMVAEGFLWQDPERGQYQLGLQILTAASVLLETMPLLHKAKSFMKRLLEACEETVDLAVQDRSEIVYIDRLCGPKSILTTSIGGRAPLHCTALGKSLLCDYSLTELRKYMVEPLPQFTENTIISIEEFAHQLENIKQNGYALDDEEHKPGGACVAAPVRDERRRIVAAIGISGPKFRLTSERKDFLIANVKWVADSFSELLGYRPEEIKTGEKE